MSTIPGGGGRWRAARVLKQKLCSGVESAMSAPDRPSPASETCPDTYLGSHGYLPHKTVLGNLSCLQTDVSDCPGRPWRQDWACIVLRQTGSASTKNRNARSKKEVRPATTAGSRGYCTISNARFPTVSCLFALRGVFFLFVADVVPPAVVPNGTKTLERRGGLAVARHETFVAHSQMAEYSLGASSLEAWTAPVDVDVYLLL